VKSSVITDTPRSSLCCWRWGFMLHLTWWDGRLSSH